MKLQEAKLILLQAFEHEPETRAEYFKREAEKSGYSSELFFRELIKAYNQLLKYVNSNDYSLGLCINEAGNEYYQLKIIPIDNFTDGRVLDNGNITDLLKPLHDFGALELLKLQPPLNKTILNSFDQFIEETTSLEIRISKPENVYSLDHYSQFKPEYESRLKLIMNHALTDILKLSGEQITKQVKRLKIEENQFKEIHEYFEKQYSLYFTGSGFDSEGFIYKIGRYFSVTFPDGKAKNVITPQFMQCLSDAIMIKYGELSGFIAQVNEIQNTESETQAPPPPGETTKQKIEKALETLREAFEDTGHIDPETGIKTPGHIDKIIEALTEYAKGTTPDCVENQKFNCKNIKDTSNKDFYTPFKGLNKTIGLTVKKIAEVLHYFIYANDGSQNSITIQAIKRNINAKYPKVI